MSRLGLKLVLLFFPIFSYGATPIEERVPAEMVKPLEKIVRLIAAKKPKLIDEKINAMAQLSAKIQQLSDNAVIRLYHKQRRHISPISRVFYEQLETNIVSRIIKYGLTMPKIKRLVAQGQEQVDAFFKSQAEPEVELSDLDKTCKAFVIKLSKQDFASLQERLKIKVEKKD